MIIVAGIAGICLWGLFNLLDNLKEPGVLRTEKGVMVKGCDRLDAHADAPRLCPGFLCQKALVDRKLASVTDKVEILADSPEGTIRLIEGRLSSTNETFECEVQGVKVLSLEVFEPAA